MSKPGDEELQGLRELQQRLRQPDVTTDELRHILDTSRDLERVIRSKENLWKDVPAFKRVMELLCAHPNIDLVVLQKLLAEESDIAISGLFKNSVAPLLALESPTFWEELDVQTVRKIVRRCDLPPSVAHALQGHAERWLALEAETHIACAGELAPESYSEAVTWLEGRIAEILVWETDQELRLCLFDMVEEGMAPEWAAQGGDPEETEHFQWRNAISERIVAEWVKEGRGAKSAMDTWLKERPVFDFLGLERRWAARHLASHPDVHPRVLHDLQKEGSGLLRRAIRRHPRADARLLALGRARIIDMLEHVNFPPCVYFGTRYILPARLRYVREFFKNGDFLKRLALAQHLQLQGRSRNGEDDKALQELTRDPNRYVRAAAQYPELSTQDS